MSPEADTVSRRIARFAAAIRYEDLPSALVERAKLSILDALGLAVVGAAADSGPKLRSYVESLGARDGTSTILGTGARTIPRFAAMANACAINTYDFDDTFLPSRTHPSGPVIAAVLAEAEPLASSGKDVLTAFVAGSEVTCKVSHAIDKQHFDRGYHTTGTCGVIGAAAGVSRLLQAPAATASAAIGIAASQAAGLRENFGSMAKILHSGHAAENGVVAASLAAIGVTASDTALEGPRGFFIAYGGGFDDRVLRELGDPWSYVSPGVAIKPYPSGNISHPAMCSLLELVVTHDIRPDQVRRIGVKTNRRVPLNLTFHQPRTGLQGQLSMEFCLATILVTRRAGLADFTDGVVTSPEMQSAMSRIDFSAYSDEEAEAGKYAFLTTFLDIEMNDGRRFAARADSAKGSGEQPASKEDVLAKYRSCLEYVRWPTDLIERSAEAILELEELEDVRVLIEMLRT